MAILLFVCLYDDIDSDDTYTFFSNLFAVAAFLLGVVLAVFFTMWQMDAHPVLGGILLVVLLLVGGAGNLCFGSCF